MRKNVFLKKGDFERFIKDEILSKYNEYEKSKLDFRFGEPVTYPVCLVWDKSEVSDNEISIFGFYVRPSDFGEDNKIHMNTYYLAFNYRGDVNVAKVTANQLANELLGSTDDILDFKYDIDEAGLVKNQSFTDKYFIVDDMYVVEFSSKDPHCFNLYEYTEEEDGTWYGEHLVAENIPWVCIKIEDENGNELYNLTKEI